jgi:GxxExxY protein
MDINEICEEILRAATRVHTALGPGLLESAYGVCVRRELRHRGLRLEPDGQPCTYPMGVARDRGFRTDLVVEDSVLVELKTVPKIMSLHEAQLMSQLEMTGYPVGLLINFHVDDLADGVRRLVNSREPLTRANRQVLPFSARMSVAGGETTGLVDRGFRRSAAVWQPTER